MIVRKSYNIKNNAIKNSYPEQPDVIRLNQYTGDWTFQRLANNKVKVMTSGYADPAGSIPLSFVNMFGIDCNRKVSPEKGQWFQLRLLPNFHQGKVVWLKDFGFVQLFKTQLKEQQRFYIEHQDEDDLS